jgi:hypothetical protein
MKPTSNYKMSKTLKASLALGKFTDVHQKGAWKRAMIAAELTEAHQPRSKNRKEA